MTPLALAAFRQLALPRAKRSYSDVDGILPRLREPHCFDVTAALPIADALWMTSCDVLKETLFLPAAETWLEWHDGRTRIGYLLRKVDSEAIEVSVLTEDGLERALTFPSRMVGIDTVEPEYRDIAPGIWNVVAVFLAIINTPKLVSRRDRAPHKGLVREIKRSDASALHLRPWTEILLELTQREASGYGPDRISGRTCLHFCRPHLRIQNGRLVVVRSHWRGDAALGVSQADYRVAA